MKEENSDRVKPPIEEKWLPEYLGIHSAGIMKGSLSSRNMAIRIGRNPTTIICIETSDDSVVPNDKTGYKIGAKSSFWMSPDSECRIMRDVSCLEAPRRTCRSVNKLKRLSQGRIYPFIVEHVSRFISLGNGKPSRASKALFPGRALGVTCPKKGYYSKSVVADSWHRMHYD
ncbi:hypothetical protein TNCV_1937411 [Trichonephila clavipes]|nr:hypothetical protein TNCV_1937411 [Trichonephila clavipes]